MINAISEVMSQKTIDQYKIIESKYGILKRFIAKANTLDEVKMLVDSLDETIYSCFKTESFSEENEETSFENQG